MRAGNEDDRAAQDELTQWTERLNAVYRPLDRLALSATLPLVTKDLRTVSGGATTASSNATGPGDVEVSGRFIAWGTVQIGLGRVQEIALSAGTSMPTGPNDVKSTGERIDEHGQPGTASWGPFAGVHYRLEQQDWTAFASLSGLFPTKNAHGYTYGSAAPPSADGQYFVRRWLVADRRRRTRCGGEPEQRRDGREHRRDRALDRTRRIRSRSRPGAGYSPAARFRSSSTSSATSTRSRRSRSGSSICSLAGRRYLRGNRRPL